MSSFKSPLVVEPLPDSRRWRLHLPFSYHVGTQYSKLVIKVPKDFVTDFASVPRLTSPLFTLLGIALYFGGYETQGVVILIVICVLSWFRAWGKHGKAAVLHDWLYQSKEFSREVADLIFYEAMLVGGTKKWRAKMMYYAVRFAGWVVWKRKTLQQSEAR